MRKVYKIILCIYIHSIISIYIFKALTAVESFAKRSSLPEDFPGSSQEELSECEKEARLPSSWSVDMDTQLMQWSNQHPEDWIVGGKAKVYFWGAGGLGQLANDSKSTNRPELCEYLECTQKVSGLDIIQSTPLNRVTSVRGHFAPIKRTPLTENILY